MKKKITILIMTMVISIPIALFGQQWSDSQKEVWENVKTYTEYSYSGDIDNFFPYFHKDFVGWMNNDYLPSNKETREKFIRFYLTQNIKVKYYDIQPLSIVIHRDIAIVHYSYVTITEDADSVETIEKGGWTDILMKQGNKWVMIADHGGVTPQ